MTLNHAKANANMHATGNFKSARFFGKVLGTQKDYYVAEVELAAYAKEPLDQDTKKELAGTGANLYVYYATNSPEEEWTRYDLSLSFSLYTQTHTYKHIYIRTHTHAHTHTYTRTHTHTHSH